MAYYSKFFNSTGKLELLSNFPDNTSDFLFCRQRQIKGLERTIHPAAKIITGPPLLPR
jgi:hypothetical protein